MVAHVSNFKDIRFITPSICRKLTLGHAAPATKHRHLRGIVADAILSAYLGPRWGTCGHIRLVQWHGAKSQKLAKVQNSNQTRASCIPLHGLPS